MEANVGTTALSNRNTVYNLLCTLIELQLEDGALGIVVSVDFEICTHAAVYQLRQHACMPFSGAQSRYNLNRTVL